jgi:hypothetical protein
MSLLEYQTMPSLRDVAHEEWLCTFTTLQRKLHLYIPFLGIAPPQYQFPHLCVCERFIYSHDQSTYFLKQNSQTDPGNI